MPIAKRSSSTLGLHAAVSGSGRENTARRSRARSLNKVFERCSPAKSTPRKLDAKFAGREFDEKGTT